MQARPSAHASVLMRLAFVLLSVPMFVAIRDVHAQCAPPVQRLAVDRRFEEARADIAAQLKRNEHDGAALFCMGRLYQIEGNSSAAVDWYEKAVHADDKNAFYHFRLGEALGSEAQKASKFRQPILARRIKSEFERTVALDPDLGEGHEGLMQFYLEAPGFMGGSLDKAKEQAQVIAKLNPLGGHFAAARIQEHLKEPAAEEAELKAALEVAPDSMSAWNNLGSFYQSSKRWTDAFALYDRMIKERPNDVIAHFQYGRAAAFSGENLERGERELRYWLANAPKDAAVVTQSSAHVRLGMILDKQDKKDAARAEYQEALRIFPKNVEAERRLKP